MTATRRAFLAVASLALALASTLGSGPVLAQDAAPEVGWWTSNQVAGVPIGRALLVPPGGSQVASGAEGATSVTAVRFAAGPAGATYTAGIELGSDTENIAVVACPVVDGWEPVAAGSLADAPTWDCSLGQAVGAIDGDTIAWELPAGFVRDGRVDAMLLPTEGGGSFTLTLAAPDETSVTPLPESPSSTAPPSAPAETRPPTGGGRPAAVPPAATPARGAGSPSLGGSTPTPTAPVGLPAPLPASPVADQRDARDAEVAASVVDDVSSTTGRVLGGVVLAALLAGVALLARRSPAEAEQGGRGIGRFVRPRHEPPVSI